MTRSKVIITAADTWQKVLTNVTSGILDIKTFDHTKYRYDFVATGATAQSGLDTSVFFHGNQEEVKTSAAADIYVLCEVAGGVLVASA
jgi:hypothetical protein